MSRSRFGAVLLALACVLSALGPAPVRAAASERILVLGDSISHGSSGDYTWRYRLWQGLRSAGADNVSLVGPRTDLYDIVNDRGGSPWYADPTFAERAHGSRWGESIGAVSPTVASTVAAHDPTVVLVQLGTNDLTYSASPAQAIELMRGLVGELRRGRPTVRIVVGQVPPRYDFFTQQPVIAQEAAEYNQLLPGLVAELTTPEAPIVIASTSQGWDPQRDTYDGTHASPAGEARIAQAHLDGLARLGVAPAVTIPLDRTWQVGGPRPTLTPGQEQVAARWDRTPTGSTGVYLRTREPGAPWQELPYPIGGDEGWSVTSVTPGTTREVATRPTKWFMSGVPGPVASALVGPRIGGVAAVRVAGQDHVFRLSANGALLHRFPRGTGLVDQNLGGVSVGAPAVLYRAGRYDVFTVGPNGGLYLRSYVGGKWEPLRFLRGTAWRPGISATFDTAGRVVLAGSSPSGMTQVATGDVNTLTATTLGTSTAAVPGIATVTTGLELFTTTADGALWRTTQRGGVWGAPRLMAGTRTTSPVAGSRAVKWSGLVHIQSVAPGGNLDQRVITSAGTRLQPLAGGNMTGAPDVAHDASRFSVYVPVGNTVYVRSLVRGVWSPWSRYA